jgi:hypothetical protein
VFHNSSVAPIPPSFVPSCPPSFVPFLAILSDLSLRRLFVKEPLILL